MSYVSPSLESAIYLVNSHCSAVRYIDLDKLRFDSRSNISAAYRFGIEIKGNPREFFVGRFKIRQNDLKLALGGNLIYPSLREGRLAAST